MTVPKNSETLLTKKEFRSILKAELSDRPTVEEVRLIIQKENRQQEERLAEKFATKEDLERFATKDDVRTMMKDEFKRFGVEIVEAIERMISVKADKEQVDKIERRVRVLEQGS